MSGITALAAFRTRSFRFQWPADLCTAWALEMETLILGWYVLTETGSVVLLTVFGSLLFVGTLVSPLLGVLGDRLGLRKRRKSGMCGSGQREILPVQAFNLGAQCLR